MRFKNSCACLLLAVAASVTAEANVSFGQGFVVQSRVQLTGDVRALNDDKLTVADADGKITVFKVQRKGERSVSIDGKFLRAPANVKVTGQLTAADFLSPNMVVKFNTNLRKGGRSEGDVRNLNLVASEELASGGLTVQQGAITEIEPPNDEGVAKCEVAGVVQQFKKGRLTILIDQSSYASKNRLRVELADDATIGIASDDLKLVQAGDKINLLNAMQLATGHLVINSLEVELQGTRSKPILERARLDAKYQRLSDKPSPARDVRSQHFLLHTDVSDRQGQILLDKLETMVGLISNYYRRRPRGIIECYVVRDLNNWSAETFPAGALEKIREPAGVTITRSLGKQRQTVVFSCDRHQTVQHEAVHAYCQQTFGSTGPVWYSEGMAEMGAYWKQGQLEVNIRPGVIRYLTNAKPKKMLDIVAAGQVTGDSWQAYAWRWALCHLLANNPNFSDRLKGLGIAMMSGKPASFEATYGDVAQQISFEYDQFVKNFGNGYRADLAAWQWNVKPKRLSNKKASRTILAQYGWQATGISLEEKQAYNVVAEGTWQIAPAGEALTADGNSAGKGKLIGALFKDFELSEPFQLGSAATFVASGNGHLFVRCQDSWTELSDNNGKLKITLEKSRAP